MLHRSNKNRWVLYLIFLVFFPSIKVFAADVVVVRSRSSAKAAKLYNEAIEGIRQGLSTSFEIVDMKDVDSSRDLIQKIIGSKPKVVIAVGVKASGAVKDQIGDIPIVYCMVSHAIQKKWKSENTTGVTMQPAPSEQLKAFKKVVPDVHRIGLVYNPKLSGMFVEAAKAAAKDQGLEVVAEKIEERKEVPDALRRVLAKSDAFWILRDGKVVNREFFSQVLLLQAQRKLPVMAFSERFVKKGALCSFSSGYKAQGRQAAKLANAILSGNKPHDLPIQAPDGTLTINLTTASKIGITIPSSLENQQNVKVLPR